MFEWPRNHWYCAMYSEDLSAGVVTARLILDEQIVFWRGKDKGVRALEDRCPHRYAPLSMGSQIGADRIRCNYHGLEFDGAGRCVHNPHGKGNIPASAALKAYPVHEYCGIIWIWMGPSSPDLGMLPDLSIFECGSSYHPGTPNWLPLDVPCELMIDNLLDLSHAALLHEGILGNEESIAAQTRFEQDAERIYAYRFMPNIAPPEYFDLIYMADGSRIDMWQDVSWEAPATVFLDIGATGVDVDREQGTSVLAAHILTPVSRSKCMYHFLNARRNAPPRTTEEDEHIQTRLAELRKTAFAEQDAPMVAAQYSNIQYRGEYRPNLLPDIDKAAALWRRRLSSLVLKEKQVEVQALY